MYQSSVIRKRRWNRMLEDAHEKKDFGRLIKSDDFNSFRM